MSVDTVSLIFSAALLASLGVRLWLSSRQMRHVAAHRAQVPQAFSATVSADAHRKAADYTLAKGRLGLFQHAYGALLLLAWTLLGGLDLLNRWMLQLTWEAWGPFGYQLALIAAFSVITALLDLPFEAVSTFRIEQRFGFNRMTLGLWLGDLAKGTLVASVIGLPLVALVLWLMSVSGAAWWFWAWLAWMALNLLLLVIYPTWIAPLFNRFEPLQDESLTQRVEALMKRCGFAAQGLFVMDGSRRSAHANAYFTGLGRAKRVVFYDTLLNKLTASEVEAVLAHELGHFHHRHVLQRIGLLALGSLLGLAFLGWLSTQSGFFTGLGVQPGIGVPNDALSLLLFSLALPPFTFFLSPLMARGSRRHEFQADAYASRQADGRALASALLKLHEDNAATLTPDPWFARFYYSHPPALERLAALTAPGPTGTAAATAG